ncbi:MAG: OmpA family protein [Melioribacteraceae bacterium]|nr:OmpA family protein [Melioribacteraceae bacterium]
MKKILFTILSIVLLISFSSNSFAQLKDYKAKIGGQFSLLFPNTDESTYDASKTSMMGRAFARFELSRILGLEIGAGYGYLWGEKDQYMREFETSLITFGPRLLLQPFSLKSVNPYVYVGVEGLLWSNDKPQKWNSEEDGFATVIPLGIGTEIALSKSVLVDLGFGYNYSFTDYLYSSESDADGYWNLSLGLAFTIPSDTDYDNDGLKNDLEKKLGTDPNKADTDDDGLNDNEEINTYNTDPLNKDTDSDGLEDNDELVEYKTDPTKADTDGDSLTDGDEINIYKTEPTKIDTDEDGLNDNVELNSTKTNPTKADSDNDGLKDGAEVNTHKTDPLKADTDADGLDDGIEVNKTKTNPLIQDTDSDGLNDGVEVNAKKTDPNNSDTDGGSVKDGEEVLSGTNPLDKSDDVPWVLKGVNFATAKYDLTSNAKKTLNQTAELLGKHSDVKVEIQGHTDSSGDADKNLELSTKRALSVKEYLTSKGINADRMKAVGYGETNPMVSNKTSNGRAQNRRIEFKIVN